MLLWGPIGRTGGCGLTSLDMSGLSACRPVKVGVLDCETVSVLVLPITSSVSFTASGAFQGSMYFTFKLLFLILIKDKQDIPRLYSFREVTLGANLETIEMEHSLSVRHKDHWLGMTITPYRLGALLFQIFRGYPRCPRVFGI